MKRVFVDCDIILDLLAARHPHYNAAAILFSRADNKEVELYVSSLTFSHLYYILAKQSNGERARRHLAKMKMVVTILPVADKTIHSALFSDFKDFEDAIQYHTAIENNISTFLTRNLKDYKTAAIPVMTADQFLKGED